VGVCVCDVLCVFVCGVRVVCLWVVCIVWCVVCVV